jgi:hypothetical protein
VTRFFSQDVQIFRHVSFFFFQPPVSGGKAKETSAV